MLEVKEITKDFGGHRALNRVSLRVNQGDFIGLIGPNGSGKTTLFNVIAGNLKCTSGKILFEERDITEFSADIVCHRGIARTFQIPRPFKGMSVLENVMVAALFGRGQPSRPDRELKKEALEYVHFVGIEGDPEQTTPVELTAGNLRRLEIARALATRPKLLLVDECMSGLNPEEVAKASLTLKRIHDEKGITIIWVEHVMRAIMNLVKDEKVIKAYIGEKRT
jgi:branched-chain amino acid transport system ATP-binding protein